MSNFILTDCKTDYLLLPSVDDWLTQDHLARQDHHLDWR